MAYTSITKPSVGDPIKLSLIEAMIDNQVHFYNSLSASASFNADGDFEASPTGSEPALGWTDGGGPATWARSSDAADPNISGQYTLKCSGDAGDTNSIESALFPISENETYELTLTSKVDNIGDHFQVSFISYERDGATGPVQTVKSPIVTDASGNAGFNYTSGMTTATWLVDGGATGRWAKIKIDFEVNAGGASAGYIDLFTLRPARGMYRQVFPAFNNATAQTIEIYCPNKYSVAFFSLANSNGMVYAGGTQDPISTAKSKVTFTDYLGMPSGILPTNVTTGTGYTVRSCIIGKAYNNSAQGTTVTENSQTATMTGYTDLGVYYIPETIL